MLGVEWLEKVDACGAWVEEGGGGQVLSGDDVGSSYAWKAAGLRAMGVSQGGSKRQEGYDGSYGLCVMIVELSGKLQIVALGWGRFWGLHNRTAVG